MSLNSENSRAQYVGNGSASTPYPVGFVFYEDADLRVVVTDADGIDTPLAPGSGCTITGAGLPDGGHIVTTAAYDNTHKLTIYREVEATQKTVYEENADFPAKSHERALDKLTMLVQQISRKVRQSFRFRESDGETPEAARVLNSLFSIGADGLPAFLTANEVASFLNLSQQYFDRPIKTFADAAERALAVPEFAGQVGSQRDNRTFWIATALTAGSWASAPGAGTIVTAMLAAGILSADATGLARMADGFLAASTAGRAKMADAFITLAKLGSGIFTADVAGRAPFASGWLSPALMATGAAAENGYPGSVVQELFQQTKTRTVISGLIPFDNSTPLVSEGTQIFSQAITPKFSTSKVRITTLVRFSISTGGNSATIALFKGSTLLASSSKYLANGEQPNELSLEFEDSPASISAQTYTLRMGAPQSSAFNGTSSVTFQNETQFSTFAVKELRG